MTAAKSTLVISRALFTPASITSRLGGRRAERLGGAVELALLDLGALELHEDALVLDRAHGVAARLLDELLLARRERLDPRRGRRRARRGARRARRPAARSTARTGHGPDVVRQLVARLEARERHGRALRDRRAEDAVAREERPLGEVRRVARELADAQVRAGVVLPEQHGRVQVERLAQEAQREEHRLVDLLDARAREPLLVALRAPRPRRRRRAEQAVAPRVVAQPRRSRPRRASFERASDARDLAAQHERVERREDAP